MKTEIERARESIKEYRKGYGQSQLSTDCIVQLMIGYAKTEQLRIQDAVGQSEQLCDHPRSERSYIGHNMLKCNKCGEEFS